MLAKRQRPCTSRKKRRRKRNGWSGGCIRIKHSTTGSIELRDELKLLKKARKGVELETLTRVVYYLDNQKE
jgi:hypothetical protein